MENEIFQLHLDKLTNFVPTDSAQKFANGVEHILNATPPENLPAARRHFICQAHLRFPADTARELEDFFAQWVNPNPAPAPTRFTKY